MWHWVDSVSVECADLSTTSVQQSIAALSVIFNHAVMYMREFFKLLLAVHWQLGFSCFSNYAANNLCIVRISLFYMEFYYKASVTNCQLSFGPISWAINSCGFECALLVRPSFQHTSVRLHLTAFSYCCHWGVVLQCVNWSLVCLWLLLCLVRCNAPSTLYLYTDEVTKVQWQWIHFCTNAFFRSNFVWRIAQMLHFVLWMSDKWMNVENRFWLTHIN